MANRYLITDEMLAAARAEVVFCFANTECLKTYTAEQLEAIALFLAADRLGRQRDLGEIRPEPDSEQRR